MDQDLFLESSKSQLRIVGCTASDYNARTPISPACHSLNDFLLLYAPKQTCSSFFHTHLMICMARQCALQSFVILDTVLHKNPTIQLQLIKKINLQQLTRT